MLFLKLLFIQRSKSRSLVFLAAVDFFNQINMLYGTITEFCTEESCPIMSAGPKYEYHWADGHTVKKPIKCSAPKYIDYLMTWVQDQLDDEALFPSKIGDYSIFVVFRLHETVSLKGWSFDRLCLSQVFRFPRTFCRLPRPFWSDYSEFMPISTINTSARSCSSAKRRISIRRSSILYSSFRYSIFSLHLFSFTKELRTKMKYKIEIMNINTWIASSLVYE